ncbi:cation diffusion facilitator family transporter [Paenibacillus xylaniclasticus]|uniref:cation diffusion facilitator family transporter n=1 Tax=Paenibacillus xylaniclasticus TaxID=588083 RepID=UPI000FDB300C|nr:MULTISPECIES: cation diffusion facilitator family transporter [Paenibacillus]GFN33305.1 putative transporter YdfM [Paenibacillus curdlanolyticus]
MKAENNSSIAAVWISLFSNIFLTAIKVIVGVLFKSQVLLADGIHNAGDVIATGAALSSMKISKQPADEDHPYGHGKAEVLGSGIVAFILALASIYMGYHAVLAFWEEPAKASWIALAAAIVSLIWKLVLYLYTMRLGRQSNSKALIATAYDHLADVYASIAAVVGIGLSMIGEAYDLSLLLYGDPAAGIIVSFLVLKLAYEMARESMDILMEKTISEQKLSEYEALIYTVSAVKRIDRLRAREHGHYILVDVRVSIPAEMTIQQGHDVTREIKKAIMDKHDDVGEVLIHLNPWYKS